MERTKYDGKLTDALIQTVIDAENRQNGLESNDVPYTETDTTPQIERQQGTNSPVAQFFGWSDQKARPTASERGAAWVRNNCDYVPPDGEQDE